MLSSSNTRLRSRRCTAKWKPFVLRDNEARDDGGVAYQCFMRAAGFDEGYYTRALKRPVAIEG